MNPGHFKVSLLIPTFNAGPLWMEVLESIKMQTVNFDSKIIVDSGSDDNTVDLAIKYGFEVINIPKQEFNHGATRQLLINHAADADIGLFLTQDAILAMAESVEKLISAFTDATVALAYGRQLPHKKAGALESHARLFNYPANSIKRAYSDKDKLGFKVFFCSNSYAAYRIKTLNEAGGFPTDSIMGEDALVGAKLLLQGYKIAYVDKAAVYHSHSYTLKEEFKRYFDTRVFHEQNDWLIDNYGKPTGEGIKYVKSEIEYILKYNPISIFKVAGSVFAKWLGYTAGKFYSRIPVKYLKKLSMHSSYWK